MAEASVTDWMIAVCTALYTLAAALTLLAIKGQLKHMECETRPWISIEDGLEIRNTTFQWQEEVLWAQVDAVFKNYGKVPGAITDMYLETVLMVPPNEGEVIAKKLNSLRKRPPARRGNAQTLFPHSRMVFRETTKIPRIVCDSSLVPYLVGTVGYKAGNVHHRTTFAYQYRQPNTTLPVSFLWLETIAPGVWTEWATIAD